MPTYEYKCDACGHKFEELQSIKSDPLTLCPICDKKTLRRLFGTPALHFQGEGWTPKHYGENSTP